MRKIKTISMNFSHSKISTFLISAITICLFSCNSTKSDKQDLSNSEFIVELPQVSYPLPIVDNITNNCDDIKKRSIKDNPIAYILRGINDIWQGTNANYQNSSSGDGPGDRDRIKTNPIIDSLIWRENIQYVLKVTHNRTDDETILAFLDDTRSKFYSVTDGFGPLTEDYIKYSGAYVQLPEITTDQVLNNTHYQASHNNGQEYAGFEDKALGAVVKLARDFSNTCSSTNASKYLYSTPRPWRMNDIGEVIFQGTTYDSINHKPNYRCVDYHGKETFKIFDKYRSNVKVVPGLMCSRKNHLVVFKDQSSAKNEKYSNTTSNIGTDNGYPSGHTNAGALISLAYAYAFPERFSELVFRGSQLGEDRIIAGMHSPVDVIGGKAMALSVACAALNDPEKLKDANDALAATLNIFGAKADSLNLSLYEYAHQNVENPKDYSKSHKVNVEVFNNNIYDDKSKIKQIYRQRLTYGFSQDKEKAGQDPIVPKGAEAILKSRFPYLTNNQRRLVLYTTELPSGYKILDKTNGWGRINLLEAADGFGSLLGTVHVRMDASLGRFNAMDSWKNDIDGNGSLIKDGTGKLNLSGNNSFTGGTTILDGTLVANSKTALGNGDVSVKNNGILEILQPLNIYGNLDMKEGKLIAKISSVNEPLITTDQNININGSAISLIFDNEIKPQKGDKLVILQGKELQGKFETIKVDGYKCNFEKIDNKLIMIIE